MRDRVKEISREIDKEIERRREIERVREKQRKREMDRARIREKGYWSEGERKIDKGRMK